MATQFVGTATATLTHLRVASQEVGIYAKDASPNQVGYVSDDALRLLSDEPGSPLVLRPGRTIWEKPSQHFLNKVEIAANPSENKVHLRRGFVPETGRALPGDIRVSPADIKTPRRSVEISF